MPGVEISSAGISALVGRGIDNIGLKLLEQKGYPVTSHKAKKVNEDLMQVADVVLTMEKRHQQQLMKDYPSLSGKVMLLGKWQGDSEISDPYKKSREAFEYIFDQIERACKSWVDVLKSS